MKILTTILLLLTVSLTLASEQYLATCPSCNCANTLTPTIRTNGGYSLPGTGSNGVWRTLEFQCIAKHEGKRCGCKFSKTDTILVPEVKIVRVK